MLALVFRVGHLKARPALALLSSTNCTMRVQGKKRFVSDEIAGTSPGAESDARKVNTDLDKAIDKSLIQNGLQKGVRYDVKNGVVILKGNVNSGSKRAQVEKVTST